jgi:hypothetical protein
VLSATSYLSGKTGCTPDENGDGRCESAPEKVQQKDRPSRSVAIRRLIEIVTGKVAQTAAITVTVSAPLG